MKIYGCIEYEDEENYINTCRLIHEKEPPHDYQIEWMNEEGGMWMFVWEDDE
jgi:hypothetical protein